MNFFDAVDIEVLNDYPGIPYFPENNPFEKFEHKPSRKEILDTLTKFYNQDLLCRKLQRWPLLPLDETKIQKVLNSTAPEEEKLQSCLKKAMALCAHFPDELFFAGGFILRCLGFKDRYISPRSAIPDVDFFVVAESEQKAISIITQCLEILKREKAEHAFSDLLRSEGCLTYLEKNHLKERCYADNVEELIEVYDLKFQFIHRLYSDRSQIVGMFDIFPCGVLYSHREGFRATPLARYCIENECLFLDPTRLSTTYQSRVVKYNNRGFKIAIPNALGAGESIFDDAYYLKTIIPSWKTTCGRKYYDAGHDHWLWKDHFTESDYQEQDNRSANLVKASTTTFLLLPIFLSWLTTKTCWLT